MDSNRFEVLSLFGVAGYASIPIAEFKGTLTKKGYMPEFEQELLTSLADDQRPGMISLAKLNDAIKHISGIHVHPSTTGNGSTVKDGQQAGNRAKFFDPIVKQNLEKLSAYLKQR